jgi:hypothetical protein
MTDLITVYHPLTPEQVHKDELLSFLHEKGTFKLFLDFVCPIKNKYIAGLFEFSGAVEDTPSGKGFTTTYEGMQFVIPSDLSWWMKVEARTTFCSLTQKISVVIDGEVKEIELDISVYKAIRVNH